MKIEKRNYSRSPWRLVTSAGAEVYTTKAFDHPDLGPTTFHGPVCGETKQEVIDKSLLILESFLYPSKSS